MSNDEQTAAPEGAKRYFGADSGENESGDDFKVVSAAPIVGGRRPKVRHAAGSEDEAPKRRGRPPKVRHDAPPAPIDGDYEPLKLIPTEPGWEYFWASEADINRFYMRPWRPAKYGVSKVKLSYGFTGTSGETIRFRELTLMEMRSEDYEKMRAADARMNAHRTLRKSIEKGVVSGDVNSGGGLVENSSAKAMAIDVTL